MAITFTLQGSLMQKLTNKEIDWLDDTVKLMLLADTYTPDQDTHDYINDVSANEVTGIGYTAGGKALTGKTATYNASTNTTTYDADDVTWNAGGATGTLTARRGALYVDTGTPSTSPIIGIVDYDGNLTATNAPWTNQWHADGIFTGAV